MWGLGSQCLKCDFWPRSREAKSYESITTRAWDDFALSEAKGVVCIRNLSNDLHH